MMRTSYAVVAVLIFLTGSWLMLYMLVDPQARGLLTSAFERASLTMRKSPTYSTPSRGGDMVYKKDLLQLAQKLHAAGIPPLVLQPGLHPGFSSEEQPVRRSLASAAPPIGLLLPEIGDLSEGSQCGGIGGLCPAAVDCQDAQWPGYECPDGLFCGRRSAWTWRCLKDGEPEGPFQCPASIQYDFTLQAARFAPQAAPTPPPATPPAPESAAPFAAAEKYTAQVAAPQQVSYLVESSSIPSPSDVLAHGTPVNLSQQQPTQTPPTPSQPLPLEGVPTEAPGSSWPGASTPLPPLISFLETADPTSANWQRSAQQTLAAADAPAAGPKEADAPVPASKILVSYFEMCGGGGDECTIGPDCGDHQWATCPQNFSCLRQDQFWWHCNGTLP